MLTDWCISSKWEKHLHVPETKGVLKDSDSISEIEWIDMLPKQPRGWIKTPKISGETETDFF